MSKRGNHEGHVSKQKRADGRYAAVLSVPGPGGTRRRKFYYGKTRAEAAAKLTKAMRDLQLGLEPVNERTTVGQYLASWLENTVKPHKAEATHIAYEVHVRRHLDPAIGHIPLARLAPAHVRRMMADQLAASLSPTTVHQIRSTLRAALRQAEADGRVHRNAAALASGPTVCDRPIAPLDAPEVKRFLEGVRGDRLEAAYVVAFTLGLRQSELLGLCWPDIDFDAATLRVERALKRNAGAAFDRLKTEKSRRVLPLPAITATALRQHRARQLEERLRAGPEWQDHDLVFTSPFGAPVSQRTVARHFKAHLRRLGLRDQRFHDARHACATFLLSQAVPMKVIQEVLGHSRINVTADIYAHVGQALQREAMDHMDRAFATL